MVMKYKMVRKRVRRTQGGSMWNNFLKTAKSFLKRNKVLSTIGNAYGATGLPYSNIVGSLGSYAKNQGYGRRRRKGGALKTSGGMCGGALKYAGYRRGGALTMA